MIKSVEEWLKKDFCLDWLLNPQGPAPRTASGTLVVPGLNFNPNCYITNHKRKRRNSELLNMSVRYIIQWSQKVPFSLETYFLQSLQW